MRRRNGATVPGQCHGCMHCLNFRCGARAFFRLLTSRAGIRLFPAENLGVAGDRRGPRGLRLSHHASARRAACALLLRVGVFLFSEDVMRLYHSLTLPVWMAHGVRGDFVDYSNKTLVRGPRQLDHPGFSHRCAAAFRGERPLSCRPMTHFSPPCRRHRPRAAPRMSDLVWSRDGSDWPNREASSFRRGRWNPMARAEETGQGPPLLLIHGTGAATHSWRGPDADPCAALSASSRRICPATALRSRRRRTGCRCRAWPRTSASCCGCSKVKPDDRGRSFRRRGDPGANVSRWNRSRHDFLSVSMAHLCRSAASPIACSRRWRNCW